MKDQYIQEAEELKHIEGHIITCPECSYGATDISLVLDSVKNQAYLAGRMKSDQEIEALKEKCDGLQWKIDNNIKAYDELQTEIDRLKKENEERDNLALEFADYLENERWKYDHKEQKTHTITEHLEYFKQIRVPSPPKTVN